MIITNPKELRIGNLVYVSGVSDTYTDRSPYYGCQIYEVAEVAEWGIHINLGHGATQRIKYDEEIIYAIDLTETTLLWFGFKKKELFGWKGNGADYQPETSKTECQDYVLNNRFFIRYEYSSYKPKGRDDWETDCSFLIFASEWYEKCIEYQIPLAKTCKHIHTLQNIYFAIQNEELKKTQS